ncbi:MAG: hypothetical protein PHC84_05155, partial [Clostridia bacterium]|nr:hypothetical protein [Clostridia bacterium]
MSVFSKKKVLGVFIIFVLVLMCVFTAGISIHTNKVSAAVNIFGVSDGVQNGNQMEFTITRDFGGITATVYYRTISGTALDGTHFTGKSGSISFADGELSKVVSVDILGAHETYGVSSSSAYTNINRDFFLEIYSGDHYEFSDPIGQGVLSALSQYSVDPDFFRTDKVFLNDTATSAISCYPNYILSIPGLGGYYDMTGSAYMLKAGLSYENALEGEIFTMGLAKSLREPEQYYGSYMVDSLVGYGFSEYAIQLYTEAAGTSIVSAPYINEPMEGFSAATNVFVYKQKYANPLTDGYVFMDNS